MQLDYARLNENINKYHNKEIFQRRDGYTTTISALMTQSIVNDVHSKMIYYVGRNYLYNSCSMQIATELLEAFKIPYTRTTNYSIRIGNSIIKYITAMDMRAPSFLRGVERYEFFYDDYDYEELINTK